MKILDKIRFWLRHTTAFWAKVDTVDRTGLRDSFAIFDKVLSPDEITHLYTSGIIKDDQLWHHICIIFRRFGRQELYIDGIQV